MKQRWRQNVVASADGEQIMGPKCISSLCYDDVSFLNTMIHSSIRLLIILNPTQHIHYVWPRLTADFRIKSQMFLFCLLFFVICWGGVFYYFYESQNMFMFLRHLGFLSFSDDNKDRLYYWWREWGFQLMLKIIIL